MKIQISSALCIRSKDEGGKEIRVFDNKQHIRQDTWFSVDTMEIVSMQHHHDMFCVLSKFSAT